MSLSRSFASLFSAAAVSAHDTASRVSPVELPGRRMALGPAVLVEAEGEDILDFLGDDRPERAEFIDNLLSRCSQEQLDEIMASLADAMTRRAARGETVGEGRGRDRRAGSQERRRQRREDRADVRDLREERRRRRGDQTAAREDRRRRA